VIALRSLLFGAAAVGVGAALWLAVKKGKRPIPLTPGTRVLLIGDSHAVGLDHPQAGNMGPALTGLGMVYSAAPKGGTGAIYWQKTLPGLLASIRPQVVLISQGGNDFRYSDPKLVAAAISDVVAMTQAAGARLIWLEPTIMPFADPNDVRGMWKKTGVETFPTLSLEPLPKVSDQIHLTWDGYKTWVRAILAYLMGAEVSRAAA